MDCNSPGSSVHGILQARILEWVAVSYSRRSSQFRDQTRVSCISCIGRQILYHCPTWKNLETAGSTQISQEEAAQGEATQLYNASKEESSRMSSWRKEHGLKLGKGKNDGCIRGRGVHKARRIEDA